ncbi:GntR family transcriptional regulator [Actinomadura madurae]|uniref:GntR family transcriptional regulator n=1 Tax=Actinomadura madurae TaxID=1993 RepID=UPI003FD8351E
MSDARAGWVSSSPRAERARRAAEVLRRDIAGGAFAGGPLPDERVLGARLGASRNAVRDALALLRDEGLITRRRGVGTMVVAPRYGHGLDRLEGLAETLAGHGAVTNEVRAAAASPTRRAGWPRGWGWCRARVRCASSGCGGWRGAAVAGRQLPARGRGRRGAGPGPGGARPVRADRGGGRATAGAGGGDAGRGRRRAGARGAAGGGGGRGGVRGGRLTRLADGRPVDCEDIRIRADRLTFHATLYRGAAARREPEP